MEPFSLANSRCKKDNSQIIVGTFGVLMNDEMKTLKSIGSVSYFREAFEGGELYAALGSSTAKRKAEDIWLGSANLQLFMSGDLLWIHTALGKEGYSGWWCPYCQMFKPDWQAHGHKLGIP